MSNTQGKTGSLVDDILASNAVLFCDQYGEAHIATKGNGGEVLKVSTKACKQWIVLQAYRESGDIPSSATVNQVVQMLEAQAHLDGVRHALDVRLVSVGKVLDEKILYDLGGKAVQVTKTGWEITEEPPIAFRRLAHQKEQVEPIPGGNIRQVLKYVNIIDKGDQLLFLAYLVAAFIPDFPHPMIIFYGTQGAGKSTPMRLMKKLIDPSALDQGLSTPDKPVEFAQNAHHNAFLFYDNLSTMPNWFSDALARAVTGSAFSKRQLYTDDDDIIYSFQRTIALNGIHQVVTRSDLLDRSILMKLERISPDKRKVDGMLTSEFEQERPYILGAIFDVLSKAMTIYPTIKLAKLPRMADFTYWGCAITKAMGLDPNDFAAAYSSNIRQQHEQAIEANPLAQIIVELMRDTYKWNDTPAALHRSVQHIAATLQLDRSKDLPKDAASLSKALKLLTVNLAAEGLDVYWPKRGNQRLITIIKTTDGTDGNDGK
jgi:hypothetical protein